LDDLVHSALEAIRPMAEAKGVELQIMKRPLVGRVRVDPDRMQQVIWNLVSNSVKFTPSGGQVRVDLQKHEQRVQIEVQDNGVGISADFLPHVFEQFRQQDAGTTRAAGGLGLGLAIARQIVNLHDGVIRAHSDGLGKGATFTVELPLAETSAAGRQASPDPGAAAESSASAPLRGLCILLVEDEEATRTALRWLIEQHGATVTVVDHAAAAVAEFEKNLDQRPYDLVVSDIGLPGEDGYALMRSLRRRERTADPLKPLTPAIALTAYARPEDREKALAAGFQSHLKKPIEPAALIKAILDVV
ncbi:MAG: two-component sensor histidine kinase, partial [Phycisphaerales bacterium]|nr:two-component sensor histidine kinase [Phycisphaerales bacterium]